MKTKIKVIFYSLIIMVAASCSEIGKEVAKNDLEGTFKGKGTMIMKLSTLNMGLEDETAPGDEVETIEIKRNESGGIYFKEGDGTEIKINNVQLATNGSTFNIPEQSIGGSREGVSMEATIVGLNGVMLGEARCDGFFDTEKNELSYSYGGKVTMNVAGESLTVPFEMMYVLYKVKTN